MTYLGNPPVNGVFKKLDSIAGSFNGSTTTFNLTSGGAATTPGLAQNLIISLGGVIQEPGSAFTINGSQITFTSAPATNTTFWGIQLGDVGLATTPNQSAMTTQVFTATAGQTTFTVAGGYTAGQIQIFENGVQLVVGSDVTASNGTTFVLTNAATAGDTLVAIIYSSFIVANAVAKSGDTMTGDLTVQTSAYLATVSGNVGVGTTSPTVIGSYKVLDVRGSGGGLIQFGTGSVAGAYVYSDGTNMGVSNNQNGVLDFFTNAVNRARIDSSGNFIVGSTNAIGKVNFYSAGAGQIALYLNNPNASSTATPALYCVKFDNSNTTSQVYAQFAYNAGAAGGGQINGNGANAAAFGSFSDERLKENIVNLPSQLANICALRPVEFDFKDGSGHQIGFIAQEMQEVYPDVVGTGADDMLTVTGWSKTEARLVAAIQELKAELDAAKARIAALEGVAP